MPRFLAHCCLIGCAFSCAQHPPLHRPPAQIPLAASGAEPRCEASSDEVPISLFIAPMGGREFQRSTWTAAQSLRCYDPEAHLEAQRLVVEFVPESSDLARARLSPTSPPLDPSLARCLEEHLAQWTMRPAPRSDIVRRRMSPFGTRYATTPGSVRVSLPAYGAPSE